MSTLGVFTLIGVVVCLLRENGWRYFCLFFGIGLTEFVSRTIVINRPQWRQAVRRTIQIILAAILFVMLGLIFGVNFQFEQIFFDLQAGIVTGALIQLVVARLIIPFFFGNAFCSRACWDGAFFEFANCKKTSKNVFQRREWLAWSYVALLILLTFLVSWQWTNPADPTYNNENILLRKNWIVGQNLFIVGFGWLMSFVGGSRFYCRVLCPFMTISSLFYRFSWFKITPVQPEKCTKCGRCNAACPMLIDVRADVQKRQKVSGRQCTLCEQCVGACSQNVLKVAGKK